MVYLELKGLQLEKSNVYRLTGFPTENLRISVGYFTKAEQKLVFVNGDYAIEINKNGGNMIGGYKSNKKF